jgi:hypothetical protein
MEATYEDLPFVAHPGDCIEGLEDHGAEALRGEEGTRL